LVTNKLFTYVTIFKLILLTISEGKRTQYKVQKVKKIKIKKIKTTLKTANKPHLSFPYDVSDLLCKLNNLAK